MLIDYRTISEDALKGIVEQFVISQVSEVEDQLKLSSWTELAISKVKSGELVIEFSEVDESVTLKHLADINLSGNPPLF